MDREQKVDAVFREYLDRLERGEAVDLKALFSRYGDLEEALWERFWTWEEARSVFREDIEEKESGGEAPSSVVQDPELFFAFREDRGEEFGRRIGEFTLLKEIGRGTMGVVFLARQLATDRLVALKLLSPLRHKSPTARERFRREVSALGRLHDRNIVSILTAGDVDGVPYFAMELVPGVQLDDILEAIKEKDPLAITGKTLADIIEEKVPAYMKPFADQSLAARPAGREDIFSRPYVEVACRFAIQLAGALEHAHSQGVLHRDVKPSNVLVDVTGRCLLSDFGLAREIGAESLTKTGELVGTPYYSAPEQIAGRRAGPDRRADIYSLGVTLYELLCLTVPFKGETTQQVFNQILVKNPVSPRVHNPGVPRELETIVFKCLEKDPDHRYQTAGELAEDLEAFLEFRPIKAKPTGPIRGAIKLIRRQRLVSAALSVALIAVLVLAGYMTKVHLDRLEVEAARRNRIEGEIAVIHAALDDKALDDAEEGLRRLQALDDKHPDLEKLRQDIALLHCELTLREAKQLQRDYDELKRRWSKAERELARLTRKISSSYTTKKERTEAYAKRKRLRDLELEMTDKEEKIIYAMNDARAQAVAAGRRRYAPVQAAFSDHFMELWREALEEDDTVRMDHYADLVRQYDDEKRYARELEGHGKLAVQGTRGARAWLFRYESYRKVSPHAVTDRLVPVPSRGLAASGPVELAPGFYAGDPSLRVFGGGLTDLKEGDVIHSIDGEPAGVDLFVEEVVPGSPAARAGAEPFQRLAAVSGLDGIDLFAWEHDRPADPPRITLSRGGKPFSFVADGPGTSLSDRSGLKVASAARLLAQTVAPRRILLGALREGKERTFLIPAGDVAGIRCEVTVYPLVCSTANALGTLDISPFECAPGSYLVLVKKKGMEDLRIPVLVPRGKPTIAKGRLLPAGFSPPGFVRVSAGPFTSGGDRKALWPEDETTREVKEFWIARREVTVGEWFAFLNDPRIGAEIEKALEGGRTVYLPRYARRKDLERPSGPETVILLAERNEATGLWESHWKEPATPVVGVSCDDVARFLEWKNEIARSRGEPWEYDIPSQPEWEKAARGVDRRCYPWGSGFDFTFCMSRYAYPVDILPENYPILMMLGPGFRHPVDESVFAVRDMAGSVVEWNRDLYLYERSIRGGAYDGNLPELYRAASRDNLKSGRTAHNLGFRLIARPRKG